MLRLYVSVSLTDDEDGYHLAQEVLADQVVLEVDGVLVERQVLQVVQGMVRAAERRIAAQADERVALVDFIADEHRGGEGYGPSGTQLHARDDTYGADGVQVVVVPGPERAQ